jgi:GNAT superfamily N-acetyltransferase
MFDPFGSRRLARQHPGMIRAAAVDDADRIARVQVDSWHGTYRGLMPDEVIDRLTVETRERAWNRALSDPEPRSAAFVALHDADVVGVAGIGPTRDGDLDAGHMGEIRAIYVTPDHWGHGHGRGLMVESMTWLARAGFTEAMLWVLDKNQIGRSFYERGGWRHDGVVKIDESFGAPLRELRYRIPLIHRR